MSKSPHVRQSSILFCCCFSSGSSLPLLRPPSSYKLLFNCDTSDAVICRTKIPFPNSSFSRYWYLINSFFFLIEFFSSSSTLYASSPPTANQLSLRSGRVPRHLSSCVSPAPLPPQRGSAPAHAHCEWSFPPSLPLSPQHTHAHALPSPLTSLHLLRKRWCGTPLRLPYKPHRAAFIKMLRMHIDAFQPDPPALRGTLLPLSCVVGDCCVEEN